MTPAGSGGRPSGNYFGVPPGDPLASRLFPRLPGSVTWGLDRTERVLSALGDPHRAYPVLHVGGTNGKGSVARIWAAVLQAAGLRTGLYTSPHLVSFRERILVDGDPLPDAVAEEWAVELRPLLMRETPSFFEAATAFAFLAFHRAEVDVAVVEVGLGGRLDATNVVRPVLTAVTNVALDHERMLGPDTATIAREKAGILKPGVPAFTASDDPAVLAVLSEEAASLGTLLRRVPVPSGRTTIDGSVLRLEDTRWGALDLVSPLIGVHQLRNLALAVRALEALPPRLPVSRHAVIEGVLRARVPGRFQIERHTDRPWVLDVAHNPAAAHALARTLVEVGTPAPRVALVGVLEDKLWHEILAELAMVVQTFVLTIPPSAPPARRWDPEQAARALPRHAVRVVPDFDRALAEAEGLASGAGTVVVTGSCHTVGDALSRLGRIPREALPPSFASG